MVCLTVYIQYRGLYEIILENYISAIRSGPAPEQHDWGGGGGGGAQIHFFLKFGSEDQKRSSSHITPRRYGLFASFRGTILALGRRT